MCTGHGARARHRAHRRARTSSPRINSARWWVCTTCSSRRWDRTRPSSSHSGNSSGRDLPTRDDVVLHGDFRLGNLLVDRDGLVAAIDWELAHLGDPLEDLAWFSIRAWSFGGPGEVAGVGSVDQLADAYEQASGTPVDRAALRWWRAVETLRWGVICMLQAHTHLSGASRSVELAAIGRRVCETEYDLVRLLR